MPRSPPALPEKPGQLPPFLGSPASPGLQDLGGEEVKLLTAWMCAFLPTLAPGLRQCLLFGEGGKGGLAWTQVADRHTMLLRSRDRKTLIFKRDP